MSIIGNKGSLSRLLLIYFDEGDVDTDQSLIFLREKNLNWAKILEKAEYDKDPAADANDGHGNDSD